MTRSWLSITLCALVLLLAPAMLTAQTPTLNAVKGATGSNGEGDGQSPSGDAAEDSQAPTHLASPRATLTTFLEAMGRLTDDSADEEAWRRVYSTLEMSAAAGNARKDAAWQLLGVFNGLGKVDPESMAPGKEQIKNQGLKSFEFFPDNPNEPARKLIEPAVDQLGEPPAEISFTRVESGAWKFSSDTMASVQRLYAWVESRGVQYGIDISQRSTAAWLRSKMPNALKGPDHYLFGLEYWQWVGLLVLAFICVCIDFTARVILAPIVKRLVNRYLGEADDDLLKNTVRPMGLALGALAFLILVHLLGLTGVALTVLATAARIVLVVCITWSAWMLVDLVSAAFLKKAMSTESSLDDMIIPLLRKTIKLFIVVMGVIYVLDSFEIELLPLLGSLGLAGLAVSFAAQDMVKNLFGGLSIFMDQPFKVGERINYKGYDGVIEEIGFRITRLRTLTGHLVTIPNGSVTNEPIENIGRRPFIRRILDVTITYDTPKEKIEQAVRIIKDICEEDEIKGPIHGRVGWDEYPPRVYFTDYNAASLNIRVIYWFMPPAYWDFLEHCEKFNLRLFEEYEKAGIEFAFPTQTLYLAGDPNRPLSVGMNPIESKGDSDQSGD